MKERLPANGSVATWIALVAVALIPVIVMLGAWERPPLSGGVHPVRDASVPALFAALGAALAAILAGSLRTARLGLIAVLALAWIPFHILSSLRNPVFDLASILAAADLVYLLYGFALTALLASLDQAAYRRALTFILMGWTVFALGLAAYIATIPADPDFDWIGFGYVSRNVRRVATFCAATAGFGLGMTALLKRRGAKLAALTLAVLSLAFVAGSGSRGPFLATLGAVLLALPLLARPHAWALIRATGLSLAMAFPLAWLWAPDTTGFGLARLFGMGPPIPGGIGNGRMDLWLQTIEKLKDVPFAGYGRARFHGIVEADHYFPHNILLQYWFDWGWVGGTAALAVLLVIFLKSVSALRRAQLLVAGPFLATVTMLINSLVDGALYGSFSLFIFATFAAAAIAGIQQSRSGFQETDAASDRRSATSPMRSPTT